MLVRGIPPEVPAGALDVPSLSLDRPQIFFGTRRQQEYAVQPTGAYMGRLLKYAGLHAVSGPVTYGAILALSLPTFLLGEMALRGRPQQDIHRYIGRFTLITLLFLTSGLGLARTLGVTLDGDLSAYTVMGLGFEFVSAGFASRSDAKVASVSAAARKRRP